VADDSAATLLLAGARLIWYAGCLVVIGAAAFRAIAGRLDDLHVAGWMRSAAGIGGAGAFILLAGTALRLYAQTYSMFGLEEPITPALLWLVAADLPPWSTGWALQLAAGLTAAAAFGIARWRSGRAWSMAQLAAAAIAATMPLTGHAVAQPDWYLLPIALQAGHALGAGTWLGGLFVLLVVSRDGGRPAQAHRAVARLVEAFSPVALAGVGLLTLSGAGTTLLYLDRAADLVQTPYGLALLWKLGLRGRRAWTCELALHAAAAPGGRRHTHAEADGRGRARAGGGRARHHRSADGSAAAGGMTTPSAQRITKAALS
jgi:putative copper export protein